jgi:hypothetical protein
MIIVKLTKYKIAVYKMAADEMSADKTIVNRSWASYLLRKYFTRVEVCESAKGSSLLFKSQNALAYCPKVKKHTKESFVLSLPIVTNILTP